MTTPLVDDALDGKLDMCHRFGVEKILRELTTGRSAVARFGTNESRRISDAERAALIYQAKQMQHAEVFAWDDRIVQMVKESAAKLPGDVPFSRAWCYTPSGIWWFGRQSRRLILQSDIADDEMRMAQMRRACCAIAFYAVPDAPDSIKLHGFSYDHHFPQAGPVPVSGYELMAGETLDELMARMLGDQQRAVAMTTEISAKARHALAEHGHDPRIANLDNTAEIVRYASEHDLLTPDERRQATEGFGILAWVKASVNLATFFLAGSLWLQQEIVEYHPGTVTRASRRRAERIQIAPTVHVVELRKRRYEHPPGEEGHHDVAWSCSWVVRGHWRKQPVKEGTKLIWIDPHVKGDTEKPLKGTDRVFVVRR